MSELLRKAAELRGQQQCRAAADLQVNNEAAAMQAQLRQASEQQAGEFIALMIAHGVPKLSMYIREYTPGDTYDGWSPTTAYIHYGRGWVTRENVRTHDNIQSGLFLRDDGKTYHCGRVVASEEDHSRYGPIALPNPPYVMADATKHTGQPLLINGFHPYSGENIQALAEALVRYGVA
jgi:hypothetical protein